MNHLCKISHNYLKLLDLYVLTLDINMTFREAIGNNLSSPVLSV